MSNTTNKAIVKENKRILVIDDNPDIHADFQKILAPQGAAEGSAADLAKLRASLFKTTTSSTKQMTYQLDRAMQGEEGAMKVRQAMDAGEPYAMAFVDMRMPPGWDGLRTIQELWRIDPQLQVVISTAFSDNPWEDIEAAAKDTDRLLVLKKPFDAIEVRRLAATLTAKWRLERQAALKVAELEHLVTERTAEIERLRQVEHRAMEDLQAAVDRRTIELRKAATHDVLTGLPNRTLFHDRLSQALANRADSLVSVLFIDFDRFKVVNDSLGHEAGDQLLKAIAARLTGVLRETDAICAPGSQTTASRLGGDEFCVLITGLRSPVDACVIAKRILETLEQPYTLNGHGVTASASIGIAVSGPKKELGDGDPPAETAESMIRDADNAMYRAKAQGKARYVMFDSSMHDEAVNRLTIENDLQRAVERNELRTYFQPVVSLINGELMGAEALVRWQHSQRGRIMPDEFIKIAEETGYIDKLGQWVLEDACAKMAHWRATIPAAANARVNVNVAKRQLDDPTFGDWLEAMLVRTRLEPSALALEITETALMELSASILDKLNRIRGLGIRVLLDDFGTGFSSLSVLHKFPLDGLKIDRSFVMDASGRRRYAAVIQSIMSLVHNLGMEAVAEGVESMEHVALLQSMGCTKGQGYLFSPPVSSEEMESLLRQSQHGWVISSASAA